MATLAPDGRINEATVDSEIVRLERLWAVDGQDDDSILLAEVLGQTGAAIDPFDRVQLAEVIRICRSSRSASQAGRKLFSVSRLSKSTSKDADRIRKYLARFGTSFEAVQPAMRRQ